MKKLFTFTAIMVCLAGSKVFGEMFSVPEGNTSQPAFMDYGGTKYSTGQSLSESPAVIHTTASVGPCVFQNVIFSSSAIGSYDFVQIWDSSSTFNLSSAASFRFFNTGGSTATVNANTYAASGDAGPRYPIRMKKGLIWRPSVNTYNSIAVQFWKQEDL